MIGDMRDPQSQISRMIHEHRDVLMVLQHEQCLLGNELFAIDGCKMYSDDSKEWPGTFKEFPQRHPPKT